MDRDEFERWLEENRDDLSTEYGTRNPGFYEHKVEALYDHLTAATENKQSLISSLRELIEISRGEIKPDEGENRLGWLAAWERLETYLDIYQQHCVKDQLTADTIPRKWWNELREKLRPTMRKLGSAHPTQVAYSDGSVNMREVALQWMDAIEQRGKGEG